ncbi:MAG: PHA/PHB synthase family protein [Polyangiaceae bacterium]
MRGLPHVLTLFARKAAPVGTTPADVVYTENKLRLLHYRRETPATHRTPVLMVPSLINRHYVLDLLPNKSFAEWLLGRGFDVYCIDWGTPGDEDRYLTFDEICDGYLGRAVRTAAKSAHAGKVHLLGYCMGGILGSIYTAAHEEQIASLVTLAAPIRFDGSGLLGAWTRSPTYDVRALVAAYGNVPWQLMQSAFHMLRPTMTLAKIVHMLDRAWDDESLDGFLALETWGNDNVALPGEAYRRYIEELYQQDKLARGEFTLSGRPARLQAITCPTLAITFQHDNIVPWESAKELVDLVSSKDKDWLHLPGGHIGAVVSKSASKRLWPKIAEWWAARDEHDASATTNSTPEKGASSPPVSDRKRPNGRRGRRRTAEA